MDSRPKFGNSFASEIENHVSPRWPKKLLRTFLGIIPFFELLRALTPKLLGLQCSVFLPRVTPKIYLEIGYLLIGKNLPEVGPI